MIFFHMVFLSLIYIIEPSPVKNIVICNASYVDWLNNNKLGWIAGYNQLDEYQHNAQQLRGRESELDEEGLRMERLEVNPSTIPIPLWLPTYFDARFKWHYCKSITEIKEQGKCCGSCWAVSAAATMSDRQCIHTNGRDQTRFSAEDLLCLSKSGCSGYRMENAWKFWCNNGIVSEGCKPYSPKPCSSKPWNASVSCTHPRCQSGYKGYNTFEALGHVYQADKRYGEKIYGLKGELYLMAELYENGPIEVDFQFYDDFNCYKKGVYRRSPGAIPRSRHAAKLIGWGEENRRKYWLLANSYGPQWGDHGFFKILRGENECEIEGFGVTGIPRRHLY